MAQVPSPSAIEDANQYYAEYGELQLLKAVFDNCCGGANRMLVNAHVDKGASGIFAWEMG